ncbi:host specificity factor TipJ family phage tail protein, partial [Niveispirillum sp.]|uniref:host specificity factor TipJ family phage tail protein n=1 Tax=Niveispirillum sp. TaxID=1917217 RepID=UPI001B5270F8
MTDICSDGAGLPAPVTLHALASPFRSDAIRVEVAHGRTISEILAAHGLPIDMYDASVWIGDWRIPREIWHRVRPGPGQLLTVRVMPAGGGGGGKSVLRVVATIAIMYAAYQLGGPLANALFADTLYLQATQVTITVAAASTAAVAATTAALAVTGTLLLNALMPVPKPRLGQVEQRYSIGATNNGRPYGLIPVVLGRMRWAPPYAAKPWTELVGQDQYVRILFDLGPGPLSIDQASMRLGDTPLSDYDDVEVEVREGYASDTAVTIMPGQVEELSPGAGLPSGALREQDGWIIRVIDQDADELSVDFSYPAGIWRRSDSGKRKSHTAGVALGWRAADGTGNWRPFPGGTLANEHRITTEDEREIRVSYRVAVPRGRYQVRAMRLVDNTGDNQYADSVVWIAARATLNEAAVTPRVPHAFVALRIRASGQLSGTVTDFTLITTRVAPDWDETTQAWVARPTRNPASLAIWAMQGPANPRPYTNDRLDWPAWIDLHRANALAGRTYDAVLDTPGTLFDTLRQICACGRGRFAIRDTLLSVIRDRVQAVPVALISPRNSWGFKMTRVFADIPHALRVRFVDAGNDFETGERIVYDDGYDASTARLFEVLDLPGITDSDLAWKDGRYHLAQLRLRPAVYEVSQDFENLIVQRGDRVDLQHDVMLVGVAAGRIKAVSEDRRQILVDEACAMQAGKSYVVRIRSDRWAVVDMSVTATPGTPFALSLVSPAPGAVAPGDLFTFGEAGLVTVPVLVKSIMPGANLTARLEFVDYAVGIHEAETGAIPPYDPVIVTDRLPAVQGLVVREVSVWLNGTEVPAIAIDWSRSADPRVDSYALQLRDPSGIWTSVTASRRTGHDISPAAIGTWQVRLQAVSADGRRSPFVDAGVTVDGIPDFLPPSGVAAVESTAVLADGSVQPAIAVTWVPFDSASMLSVIIRWREEGAMLWQQVDAPWGAGRQVLAPVRQPARYEIQVASAGAGNVRSEWGAVPSVSIAGGIIGARVVRLELFEQGGDTTFEGRDVRIVWAGSFPDTGASFGAEPFGAGTAQANPYWRGYVVRVFDAETGVLLRTEAPQIATDYTYAYDDNVRDGGPRRRLRFAVSILPKVGAELGTAILTVSNPAPGLPADLVVEGVTLGVRVAYTPSADNDWRGVRVYMGDGPDVPIDPAHLVYSGPDTDITLPLPAGAVRYVRVAQVDAFGPEPLTLSPAVAVTALAVATADLADRIIGPDQLTDTLSSRIDLVDGPPDLAGSVAARLAAEAQARADALVVEAQARADALLAEAQARADDLAAEAQARADDLAAEALARGTAISNEASIRESADGALASTISTVSAVADGAVAAIQTEQEARISADGALASSITTLTTRMGAAEASITIEQTVRADGDSANASSITTLSAQVNHATTGLPATRAALLVEQTARADGDSANAGAISTLSAQVNHASTGLPATRAALLVEQTARADGDSANAGAISTLSAQVNHASTGLPATRAAL